MIDQDLRRQALKLTKHTPVSSEDVFKLLRVLEALLKQSTEWTVEDNLVEARGILCSITVCTST